ncbi:MAG: AMP-binding protein [Oculatellaceae cyanobacterium Prado106]|jgi:long-chain acyl-CoA synthetase|nr:AMP-binding protein [Oculatellaceae cyanobacterium Prado106]
MNAVDYRQVQSLPEVWAIAAQRFATITAVHDPHSNPEQKLTYGELYQQMQQFAAALQTLGVKANPTDEFPPRVALISDNQPRWLVADQGVMMAGGVDVVRSSQADAKELQFILGNSGAIALIVENAATFQKIRRYLHDLPIQFVIFLTDEAPPADETLKILRFSEAMALGAGKTLQPVKQSRDTLATLMYTSGTSGMPKGVMLTHGNLVSQVAGAATVVLPQPGERVLSILPIWHCYERTFEYFIFAHGCSQVYTNIRFVKKDIKEFSPHYMVGVPRLWESIYEGIQKQFRDQPAKKQKLVNFFLGKSDRYIKARRIVQGLSLDHMKPSAGEKLMAMLQMALLFPLHQLGDRLVYQKIRAGTGGAVKILVSGGGSIADHLEDFFEVVGVPILSGYGLTETAPIATVRSPQHNLRGADGQPLPNTEIRIADLETRQSLPKGKQGLVLIRGPQVMQGYYLNPQATAKAIDSEGWFDSGDLGMVVGDNHLVITGRAKDTIVLTNGENIEPQPIEDACLRSPYIDQIMLVGQDQRSLGALIVPNPEALLKWAEASNPGAIAPEGQVNLADKSVEELFRQELIREVRDRPGYRADDRIGPFRLLTEPFTSENGLLTQTLKIRRNVVTDRYRGMIDEMFT